MSKNKKRKALKPAVGVPQVLQRRVEELERALAARAPTVRPKGGFTAYEHTMFQSMVTQKYSAADLRRVYEKTPVIRFCIDAVVRQIIDMQWELKGTDALLAQRVTQWLKRPNAGNDSFDTTLTQALYDLLILDRGILLKVFNVGGDLTELFARDAATFFPNYDEFGVLHGYVQKYFVDGKYDTVPFAIKEIVWLKAFPKSYSIPGFPIIESLINEIAGLLYGSEWFARSLAGEEIPLGILHLGQIGPEAVERARASFKSRAEMSRGVESQLRVIDNVDKVAWVDIGKINAQEVQASQILNFLERMIMRSFGIIPPELASGQGTVKGLRLRSSSLAEPLAKTLAKQLNQDIFKQWGLEFRFKARMAFTPADLIQMVRGGLLTSNEARDMLGYDPKDGGDELAILSPTGLVGLGGAFGGFGGQQSSGGPSPHPITSPQPTEQPGGEDYVNVIEESASPPFSPADAQSGKVFERRKHWSEWKVNTLHPKFTTYDEISHYYGKKRGGLVRGYRAAVMPLFEKLQARILELSFGDVSKFQRAWVPAPSASALRTEIHKAIDNTMSSIDIEMWRYFNEASDLGKWYGEASAQSFGATKPVVYDDKQLKDLTFPILSEKRRWMREILMKHVDNTVMTHYTPSLKEEDQQNFFLELSDSLAKAVFNLTTYLSIIGAVSQIPFLSAIEFFNSTLVHTLPSVLSKGADALSEQRLTIWICAMDDNSCDGCRDLHGTVFTAASYAQKLLGTQCCGGNCRCDQKTIAREFADDSQLLQKAMDMKEVATTPAFDSLSAGYLNFSSDVISIIKKIPELQRLEYFGALPIIRSVDTAISNLVKEPGGWALTLPKAFSETQKVEAITAALAKSNFERLANSPGSGELFLPRLNGFTQAVREDVIRSLQKAVKPPPASRLELLREGSVSSIKALQEDAYFSAVPLKPFSLSSSELLFQDYFKTFVRNKADFIKLPGARSFQELIQSQVWTPAASKGYWDRVWKETLPDYGWKPNLAVERFAQTWDKKLLKYGPEIGLTPKEHSDFIKFLKETLPNYPLLQRTEFYEYLQKLGPLTEVLKRKYKTTLGLGGLNEVYPSLDPFIYAHEVGHHVFHRYFLSGHAEALPKIAALYKEALRDWQVRVASHSYNKPSLLKRTAEWADRRSKLAAAEPKALVGEPTGEAYLLYKDLQRSGTPHWIRPWSMFDLDDFTAEMFAYYTTYPQMARQFSMNITDEFGRLIDEFVFGMKMVGAKGATRRVPKRVYGENFVESSSVLMEQLKNIANRERALIRVYRDRRYKQDTAISLGGKIPRADRITLQRIKSAEKDLASTLQMNNTLFNEMGFKYRDERKALITLKALRFRWFDPDVQDLIRQANNITREWFLREIAKVKDKAGVMRLYREIMDRDVALGIDVFGKGVKDPMGELVDGLTTRDYSGLIKNMKKYTYTKGGKKQ